MPRPIVLYPGSHAPAGKPPHVWNAAELRRLDPRSPDLPPFRARLAVSKTRLSRGRRSNSLLDPSRTRFKVKLLPTPPSFRFLDDSAPSSKRKDTLLASTAEVVDISQERLSPATVVCLLLTLISFVCAFNHYGCSTPRRRQRLSEP